MEPFRKITLTDTENILCVPHDYIKYYKVGESARIIDYKYADFTYNTNHRDIGENIDRYRSQFFYRAQLKTVNILIVNPIFDSDVYNELDYYKDNRKYSDLIHCNEFKFNLSFHSDWATPDIVNIKTTRGYMYFSNRNEDEITTGICPPDIVSDKKYLPPRIRNITNTVRIQRNIGDKYQVKYIREYEFPFENDIVSTDPSWNSYKNLIDFWKIEPQNLDIKNTTESI